MKLSLASTAELYREHRRTSSPRKRAKIAAELQRRHDELNSRPCRFNSWWRWENYFLEQGGRVEKSSGGRWVQIHRFDFAVELP